MTDLDAYILEHHLTMRTCLEEISTIKRLIKHVEEIAAEHPDRDWFWIIESLRDIAVDDRDHGWVDEAQRKTSLINWVRLDLTEKAKAGPPKTEDGHKLMLIKSLRSFSTGMEKRWFEADSALAQALAHQYVERHNINLVPLLEKVETEGGDA